MRTPEPQEPSALQLVDRIIDETFCSQPTNGPALEIKMHEIKRHADQLKVLITNLAAGMRRLSS